MDAFEELLIEQLSSCSRILLIILVVFIILIFVLLVLVLVVLIVLIFSASYLLFLNSVHDRIERFRVEHMGGVSIHIC